MKSLPCLVFCALVRRGTAQKNLKRGNKDSCQHRELYAEFEYVPF